MGGSLWSHRGVNTQAGGCVCTIPQEKLSVTNYQNINILCKNRLQSCTRIPYLATVTPVSPPSHPRGILSSFKTFIFCPSWMFYSHFDFLKYCVKIFFSSTAERQGTLLHCAPRETASLALPWSEAAHGRPGSEGPAGQELVRAQHG